MRSRVLVGGDAPSGRCPARARGPTRRAERRLHLSEGLRDPRARCRPRPHPSAPRAPLWGAGRSDVGRGVRRGRQPPAGDPGRARSRCGGPVHRDPTAHNLSTAFYLPQLTRALGTRNCFSPASLDSWPPAGRQPADVRRCLGDAGAGSRPERTTRDRRGQPAGVQRTDGGHPRLAGATRQDRQPRWPAAPDRRPISATPTSSLLDATPRVSSRRRWGRAV